jgi:uncharacterized membrane protein YfcA
MLVPLRKAATSRRAMLILVLIVASTFGFVVLYAYPLDTTRYIGACFIGIGDVYVLLHSKLGRWNFRQARVMPFVSTFWTKIGEKGTQSVYLGIGLGLIGIGCGLLIKSFV